MGKNNKNKKNISQPELIMSEEQKQISQIDNCVTIQTIQVIPKSEYDKLLLENQQLKQQLSDLRGKQIKLLDDITNKNLEIEMLRKENKELRDEIEKLKYQMNELNNQLVSLNKMKNEFDKIKIYQKMSDSFKGIISDMKSLFCDKNSNICQKSLDDNIYYLKDHLYEFHTKKYSGKYSPVKRDLKLWNDIYDDVKKILLSDFNIGNIEIFFEIIELTEQRNAFSHTTDKITLDELKIIALYADQIFDCYNKYNA